MGGTSFAIVYTCEVTMQTNRVENKHIETTALKKLDYFRQWYELNGGRQQWPDYLTALNEWLKQNPAIPCHSLCLDEIQVIQNWRRVGAYQVKLHRIERIAYERLSSLRTRASDDERDFSDGGRSRPRYRSVEKAHARWKKLNELLWGIK